MLAFFVIHAPRLVQPLTTRPFLRQLRLQLAVLAVPRHGRLNAACPFTGINLVYHIVLRPRLAPEYNVIPRWLAVGASVEAVLRHGVVSVYVCQGQGT